MHTVFSLPQCHCYFEETLRYVVEKLSLESKEYYMGL